MESQLKELYLDCPSCLRRNESEMNFCMYCGTGLKAESEVRRVTDLNLLKPCIKCGKADDLSKDFCIFCGTKIEIPGKSGSKSLDSQAFKKFSWELQRIDDFVDIKQDDRKEIKPDLPQKTKLNRAGVSWVVILSIVGLISGGMLSYFLGRNTLERIYLQLTWPKEGIVVYVEPNQVKYVLEDEAGQKYRVGLSSKNGSFSIKNVEEGSYNLKLSAPGRRTIMQNIKVRNKRTSVLGYPNRIRLPLKKDS